LTSKTPFDEVREGVRFTEKVMLVLPGFKGYKEKELRRETDRLVRSHLRSRLNGVRNDMKKIYQKIVDMRATEIWTEMDRLLAKADRVEQKIRHASYVYSGFFNAVKVDERRLDKVVEQDLKQLESMKSIESKAETFKREVFAGQLTNARAHIDGLEEALETLEKDFDQRSDLIGTTLEA
jgi:hypothetical protein